MINCSNRPAKIGNSLKVEKFKIKKEVRKPEKSGSQEVRGPKSDGHASIRPFDFGKTRDGERAAAYI
jgi:hypothetical protein